jgi:hypothetical protein
MADITLSCEACGATLTISEYAQPDNLACPKCAKPLIMPGAKTESSDRLLPASVRKAKADAQAIKEARGEQPEVVLTDISKNIHRNVKRRSRSELVVPTIKALLLFFVLAGALAYLRFFDGYRLFLPAEQFDSVRFGGFLAILFFHVVVVVEALTYDFLTGLFCLLVPGYSLYYLFTTSDSFWLRSIMLSLVIVFGRDFVFYSHDYAMGFYNYVNVWLEAGATPEPTTRLK